MIDFSIWQDPETGEPLSFNRARRGFENPRTGRLYPADSRGILHFCGAEDAVGPDAEMPVAEPGNLIGSQFDIA